MIGNGEEWRRSCRWRRCVAAAVEERAGVGRRAELADQMEEIILFEGDGDVLAPLSSFPSNLPSKLDLTHIYIHIAHYMINTHVSLIAKMTLHNFTNLGPSFLIMSKSSPQLNHN
jgi:hypothetical protein